MRVVIIGAGLAGTLAAVHLQDFARVTILAKGDMLDTNSALAQGGVAVSLGENDSSDKHFADTVKAGGGINAELPTRALIEDGAHAVKELMNWGLEFDKDALGNLDFALEAAHSEHRVLHIGGDQSGLKLLQFAQSLLRDVHIETNAFALQILAEDDNAYGVRYLDSDDNEKVIFADAVILATGGVGGLYSFTANQIEMTGDGIALAKRAGAKLSGMQYMQFHPTILNVNSLANSKVNAETTRGTLISEAVRGDGAKLVNSDDVFFMNGQDLAPRDIVAREIYLQMQNGKQVFLDISDVKDFEGHFPSIVAKLDQTAIDFRKTSRIPVAPGAHFFMGGVLTDIDAQTNIQRLYAIGEVANSGVHGANRLASNSLLECIVFAKRVAKSVKTLEAIDHPLPMPLSLPTSVNARIPQMQDLRNKMSEAVGIVRNKSGLKEFIKWTANFDTNTLSANRELTQAQNATLVVRDMAGAAYNDNISLGAHYIKK